MVISEQTSYDLMMVFLSTAEATILLQLFKYDKLTALNKLHMT